MKDYILLLGAFSFGLIIGWYVYFVNRYRKGEIGWKDLRTLIGIIGGATVLKLFDADNRASELFGAYGIGLATGFFAYFIILAILVRKSKNFDVDWFLDGRRKKPTDDYEQPEGSSGGNRAMFSNDDKIILITDLLKILDIKGAKIIVDNKED